MSLLDSDFDNLRSAFRCLATEIGETEFATILEMYDTFLDHSDIPGLDGRLIRMLFAAFSAGYMTHRINHGYD